MDTYFYYYNNIYEKLFFNIILAKLQKSVKIIN